MRPTFTALLLFLLTTLLHSQQFPIDTILFNGSDANRINLVFIPDGYIENELTAFQTDVLKISDGLFEETPFKQYRSFFNIFTILVPSTESGVDHPGTATDVTEPAHPVSDVDNRFGSSFDVANIHRLVVPSNGNELNLLLATNFPGFDQAFVVANSTEYGGSGGFFATSTKNVSASEISIHEIGHSFANLADEYYAGDQFARETNNMTKESDPERVRWKAWLAVDEVGIYNHGGSGEQALWHRPHQNCKMRFLNVPFCRVCQEAIVDRIYELVSPIENSMPGEEQVFASDSMDFSVDLVSPNPNSMIGYWILNTDTISTNESKISLSIEQLIEGSNTLTFQLIDSTMYSRSFLPDQGYLFAKTWQIESNAVSIQSQNPTDLQLKYALYPNPSEDQVVLDLKLTSEISPSPFVLQLLDASGKVISQRDILLTNESHQSTIDIDHLPAGLYYLYLVSEKAALHKSFHFIKQ